MTQILNGKEIAKKRKEKLKQEFSHPKWKNKFLAIIFLGDNVASATYVKMKKKFGKSVGINVQVFGQNDEFQNHKDVIEQIKKLNNNTDCIGIMAQLPLPSQFAKYQSEILSEISFTKDVDGLGGKLLGLGMIGFTDVLPATPAGCFTLLEEYGYSDFKGKICSVFGQSNLIGKPLSAQLMKLGATVFSFNSKSDQNLMRECAKKSDFIFSGTGKIFLIDESFIRKDKSQIIVDIGRGKKDGKPVGDVNFEGITQYLKAYTPVPGGTGPMTILSIFENIVKLSK